MEVFNCLLKAYYGDVDYDVYAAAMFSVTDPLPFHLMLLNYEFLETC